MKKEKKKLSKSLPFRERNIVLALITILLLALLLGSLTYKEVQRERYYLWELARSEGLNIAFSLQTLGPRFILNENALKDILVLLKKEGVSYIDICNDKGVILISTEEKRREKYCLLRFPKGHRMFYLRIFQNGIISKR